MIHAAKIKLLQEKDAFMPATDINFIDFFLNFFHHFATTDITPKIDRWFFLNYNALYLCALSFQQHQAILHALMAADNLSALYLNSAPGQDTPWESGFSEIAQQTQ